MVCNFTLSSSVCVHITACHGHLQDFLNSLSFTFFYHAYLGEDKATIPVTDTEFSQSVNPQSFCTGVSVHHPALIQNTGPLIDMSDIRPGTSKCFGFKPICLCDFRKGGHFDIFSQFSVLFPDPVSRKSVKATHSTRNRYSSQWTLTKCQASTPARTLTSDWRTVGSQHGITVTESDSYSASLSQDTGKQTFA